MCNHCHVCTPLYTQIGEKPDNSISAKSTIAVYIYNMYRYIYIYTSIWWWWSKRSCGKKHMRIGKIIHGWHSTLRKLRWRLIPFWRCLQRVSASYFVSEVNVGSRCDSLVLLRKDMSKPLVWKKLRIQTWKDTIGHLSWITWLTPIMYTVYIYTYQYNMYIIYIYINSYCSSRHLYKYCYSNSLPTFSWMPLIAVCTIKKHVAQCHARSGRQVPDRLLSVPIWHFTPESSHNNLVCLIVRV